MLKKTILLIFCLVAVCHASVNGSFFYHPVQPVLRNEPLTNNKSEIVKCNGLNISSDVLNLCGPIRPMSKKIYFDYRQAVCVTLFDSVEHLCNLNNATKLQLEESDPKVKNVSEFCTVLISTLKNYVYETKDFVRKDWINALKDKLNDVDKCKEACIQGSVVVSPICSTFLQINAHLISSLSEKYNAPETSSDAEMTSTNKNVHAGSTTQKAANNQHREGSQIIPKGVQDDVPIQVNIGSGVMQNQNSGEQGSDINQGPSLTENSHKQTPAKDSTINSDTPKIEKNENSKQTEFSKQKKIQANIQNPENDTKETMMLKSVNEKHTTPSTSTTVTPNKEDLNKVSSDIQYTNQVTNNSSSSVPLETKGESNLGEAKEQPLNKVPPAMKVNVKDPENNKEPIIAGGNNEKTDKQEDTNVDKTPTYADEAKLGPEDKHFNDKTKSIPEDSKTQHSDKAKVTVDGSTKKTSIPKDDGDIDPAQAQSPDTESEITDKDPDMFVGGSVNEEGGQNIGESQDPIDDPSNLGSVDDEDDIDEGITQKVNTLPERGDGMISSPEKGTYVNDKFVNAEDSHFFAYFMTMVIICIIGYLVYHNKQKILALALEGRSRRSTRRRPNTSGYRKLDSNLEEAVTSACSTSVTHVIY